MSKSQLSTKPGQLQYPPYVGIFVDGDGGTSGDTMIEQVTIYCYANAEAAIRVGQGLATINTFISNVTLYATNLGLNSPKYGIDLDACQATKIVNAKVTGYQVGLSIHSRGIPPTSTSTFGVQVHNSAFLTCVTAGCNIQTDFSADTEKDGDNVHFVIMEGCAFSNTTSGPGVAMSGQKNLDNSYTIHNVRLSACTMENNYESGITITTCRYINLVGCGVYGNNVASGSYDGIQLLGECFDVVVSATTSSAFGSSAIHHAQRYGIECDTGTQRISIVGCDLTQNVNPIKILAAATPGYGVYDNMGYNPQGLVGPFTIPSGGAAFTNQTGSAASVFVDNYSSVVLNGTVTVLPGTGGTGIGGILLGPGEQIAVNQATGGSTWQWFQH